MVYRNTATSLPLSALSVYQIVLEVLTVLQLLNPIMRISQKIVRLGGFYTIKEFKDKIKKFLNSINLT